MLSHKYHHGSFCALLPLSRGDLGVINDDHYMKSTRIHFSREN